MEMLKLMLAYKIDLRGQGALHFAAELGNIEAMNLLLDHGADIEEKFTSYNSDTVPDRAVHTPLFRACNFGQVESVRFLLEHGADPRTKNEVGVSCCEIAQREGYGDVVRLLEEEGGVGE